MVSEVVPDDTRLVVCELSKKTVVTAGIGTGWITPTNTAVMNIADNRWQVDVVFMFPMVLVTQNAFPSRGDALRYLAGTKHKLPLGAGAQRDSRSTGER